MQTTPSNRRGGCLFVSSGKDIADRLRCFFWGDGGDMGIGVKSEPGGEVPQYSADGFDIHAILEGDGGESVPLRY